MSRTAPVLIVVAAVVAAVVASPLAVAAGVGDGFAQTTADEPTENGTDAGARLAGVVGSEAAELEGDLQERSFAVAFENASGDNGKAAVIASTHESLSDRLADLRAQKASLTERYENESMARSEYQARLARLSAQIRTLTSMANRTSDAARDLPAAALDARGVNVTALDELRQNAANMSGPAVAAAARNLTRGGPPENVGPNGTPGGPGTANETDRGGNGRPENVTTGPPNDSNTTERGGQDTDSTQRGNQTDRGRSDSQTTERGQERATDRGGQQTGGRPTAERSA